MYAHRRAGVVGISLNHSIQYFVALALAELLKLGGETGVVEGEDGDGVEGCIAGAVDGHGRNGYTGGHLDYGQEGIQSIQCLGLHRHPDDGEGGQGRDDARKVCGSSSAGDDDVETFLPCGRDILGQGAGIAMGLSTRFSYSMPNSSRVVHAGDMTSQSLALPMMIATLLMQKSLVRVEH